MVYRQSQAVNDRYGGLSPDIAKALGLSVSRSMTRVMRYGYGERSGVYEDDFRCDADSGDKLKDADRLRQGR